MIKKAISIGFIVILAVSLFGTWQIYRYYKNNQAERVARMQAQAAEVKVTVIEGWSVVQIAQYFEDEGLFSKSDFLKAVEKYDTSKFPLSENKNSKQSLEGFLFPDTYRFAKTSTPEEVITKMLSNFTNRVTGLPGVSLQTVADQAKFNGLTFDEIITLASIIEKESGGKGSVDGALSLQDERNLVAGVFYNRLNIGQALESDATVNYITGKDTPAVSGQDLTVNSPYNTYKFAGLPPGPICNPSLGSIKAALNPATTDYFYFLHKQPSGKVDFSKTFDEHRSKK
jgi:UPF0755 protein